MLTGSTVLPTNYWYETNFWEPNVQLALRDLCKPGEVVFDAGANAGGLTQVMSRLVGPRGVVCAFEASPRIVDKTQLNVVVNGCSNVQVYHRAVHARSGERMKIYHGSHLNDSLYNEGDQYSFVETIAIDDFCDHMKLWPAVIKFDVEGGEFDALKGALRVIESHRPALILEQAASDDRSLRLLASLGYWTIDLANYNRVESAADYPSGSSVRNVLSIDSSRANGTPFRPPIERNLQAVLSPADFSVSDNGSWTQTVPIDLPPGRYVWEADFEGSGRDNEMFVGVRLDDAAVFRYHSYSQFLGQTYREWAIHVSSPGQARAYFDFLHGTRDSSFRVNSIAVYRMPSFDEFPPPVIY
jgi:FkbM family methyltransferase